MTQSADRESKSIKVRINEQGEGEIDIHGSHPCDDDLNDKIRTSVRQAHERGLDTLRIIHGHGHNRESIGSRFVNSNTGWLGRTARTFLRQPSELRQWMFAKIDCSHDGSTTVRLRKGSPH